MARINAGVAATPVPAIGAAMDHDKVGTDYWRSLYDGFTWTRDRRHHVPVSNSAGGHIVLEPSA